MKVDVKTTGVEREVRGLSKTKQNIAQRVVFGVLADYEKSAPKAMTDALLNGSFSVAPNAPSTARRKSGRVPLVDSGAYAHSWEASARKRRSPGSGEGIEAGFELSPEGTHKSGLSMKELGLLLEYGTRKMPARPHVEPFEKQLSKDITRDIERAVDDVLRR